MGLVICCAGVRYPLATGVMVVGRDEECAIVVDDPLVSRRHAVLRRAAHGGSIIDLGSSNGTYLNGRRVESADLQPGDAIRIGTTDLAVVVEQAAEDLVSPAPVSVRTAQRHIATERQRSALRTIEYLIEHTSGSDRRVTAPSLRTAIDSFIDTAMRNGETIAESEASRLRVLAGTLTDWIASDEMRSWHRTVLYRLRS